MSDPVTPHLWPWLACTVVLMLTLPFRPWSGLRVASLRVPWAAALLVLPWLWSVERALPGGVVPILSGACLLVLMFGWPLAAWTIALTAVLGGWIGEQAPDRLVELLWWRGLLPATLALGIGIASRHWLPRHVFVYILARAFIGSALAIGLAAGLEIWLAAPNPTLTGGERWVAQWLMGWGEATATGMLVAVFVAFRPQWLLTWSDGRYLPPHPGVP